MALPAHTRIQVYGALLQAPGATGAEIFTYSVSGAATGLVLSTLANAVLAATVTCWQASGAGVIQAARLGGVRAEAIDGAGKVSSSYNAAQGSQVLGLNTTQNIAGIQSDITLETGAVNGKGRAIRGRTCPPAIANTITGSTINTANTAAYNTVWNTWIKALNTAGMEVAVASATTGVMVPVTGTTVTNLIDFAKRRKNALVPVRTPLISV